MPRLDESRNAILDSPAAFGLKLLFPMPRTDAPQVPVLVREAEVTDDSVILRYDRANLRGHQELTPSDVLWHQLSNMLVLVVTRVDRDRVRCQGLVMPDVEEEIAHFRRSQGKGHWMCVFQAWKDDWELPSELKLPTIVPTDHPDIMDLFPGTRASGRRPWAVEGRIDPDKLLTPRTSRFLAKQREAMMQLSTGIPDEPETEPPTVEEVREMTKPGEAVVTTIPIEPPQKKGVIISYEGQDKRSK